VTEKWLFAGLVMLTAAAHAQNYPAKPVRVITPFTAGSAIDTLARVLGQKLGDTWGQQVVIDNRIGANGIIGTEAAAKAPPDGYTVYLGNISTLAVNPHLYLKLPYDALRDFAPVTLAATIPVVLVVAARSICRWKCCASIPASTSCTSPTKASVPRSATCSAGRCR
jgi:tripartite-type tricarboxylate transporter receptor subunit TctC